MSSITIDTCVWINLIDEKKDSHVAQELLEVCKNSSTEIYSSSRVFSYDTRKMDALQVENIRNLMDLYQVTLDQASFRLGASLLGSIHSETPKEGLGTEYKSERELKFIDVFGKDPIELNPRNTGKKLPNWIGDYDSLKYHYLKGRYIYVTTDTKIYMHSDKRIKAREQLGMQILSPQETIKLIQKIKN